MFVYYTVDNFEGSIERFDLYITYKKALLYAFRYIFMKGSVLKYEYICSIKMFSSQFECCAFGSVIGEP